MSKRFAMLSQKPLELTPTEALLKDFLLEYAGMMPQRPILRWTGGWVRDKLLGRISVDIDVAISNMTGMQFYLLLQQLAEPGVPQWQSRAESLGSTISLARMHQIAANPEKSKHLETITTTLFGLDVDFVNLRKEVYDDNSRNPRMEFGTAEEDALRRDATVNALFYNLHTSRVEDLTGRGLQDLEEGIIRTPLEPSQTFRDDPLRVLRLFRFASRYNFTIDDKTFAATKDKSIHKALRDKISRERVGVEHGKMVSGPDPYRAVMLIHDSDLSTAVFADPADNDVPDLSKCEVVYTGLKRLIGGGKDVAGKLQIQSTQALSWTLASYVPWHDRGKKASLAAREGIKAPNEVSRVIDNAVKHREQIVRVVHVEGTGQLSRPAVGMCIRALGDSWRQQVLFSILCHLWMQENFEDVIQRYGAFLAYVEKEGLATPLVPVLNGSEIKKTMGVKAGPWVSKAVDMVAAWQYDHPDKSKEEAQEMLRAQRGDLGLG